MKKSFLILAIICISLFKLSSQDIYLDNWKCWSSLLTPTSASNDVEGNIWVATTGGAIKVDSKNGEISEFRNISALMSLSLTVVKVDNINNKVYFGHRNGWLDILDETGNWSHIGDIFRADNFPNKQINDIVFRGNKAYIAGGFGLAVFDIEKKVFIENIIRIGDFQLNTEVNKISFFNNKIWLATAQGIASANENSFLTNPESWTVLKKNIGFENEDVKDLLEINGSIYFTSGNSIYTLESDTAKVFINDWDAVINLTEYKGKLAYATSYHFWWNNKTIEFNTKTKLRANGVEIVKYKNEEYLALFTRENGLFLYTELLSETQEPAVKIQPNTPLTNSFMDIKTNNDGSIWIAADEFSTGVGKGFMRYDGSNWEIFSTAKYPELLSDNFFKIACAPDGRVMVSNYGKGLFEVKKINNNWSIEKYDSKNSAFTTVFPQDTTPFIIAGETVFDNFGTSWTVNRGEDSPGPILVSIDKEGNSYGFINKNNISSRGVLALAIDGFGTKWVGGNLGNGKGLIYYNENNTPGNKADDLSGIITSFEYEELLANEHTALEYDYNRILWVGTPSGLVAIANLNFMFYNSKPIVRTVPILDGQPINDIAIDPQNRKWLATSKGLWVIDENGNKVLAQITMDNSPLTTNDIKAVELNELTGDVYLGTQNGLFSANTLSIKPLKEFDIKCFPQPFNLSKDTEIFIDGLSSLSEVRILTISGELVTVVHTESRKIIWNGKDINGNEVKPGVYLIVAKSGDSSASGVGKIAIIKD